MLEVDNGQALINDLWEAASAKVQLTEPMQRSFLRRRALRPVITTTSERTTAISCGARPF